MKKFFHRKNSTKEEESGQPASNKNRWGEWEQSASGPGREIRSRRTDNGDLEYELRKTHQEQAISSYSLDASPVNSGYPSHSIASPVSYGQRVQPVNSGYISYPIDSPVSYGTGIQPLVQTYPTAYQSWDRYHHSGYIRRSDWTEIQVPEKSLTHIYEDMRGFTIHESTEYKFGRVFEALVLRPRGTASTGLCEQFIQITKTGPSFFLTTPCFVIVEQALKYCICLPIPSYDEKGSPTDYSGFPEGPGPNDCASVHSDKIPYSKRGGLVLNKKIKIETRDNYWIRPSSVLNYATPYYIKHDMDVKFVGNIAPEDMQKLLIDYRSTQSLLEPGRFFDMPPDMLPKPPDVVPKSFLKQSDSGYSSSSGVDTLSGPISSIGEVHSPSQASASIISPLKMNPPGSVSTHGIEHTQQATSIPPVQPALTNPILQRRSIGGHQALETQSSSSTSFATQTVTNIITSVNTLDAIEKPATNLKLTTEQAIVAGTVGGITSTAAVATAYSTITTNRENLRLARAKLDIDRANLAIQQQVEADRVVDRKKKLNDDGDEDQPPRPPENDVARNRERERTQKDPSCRRGFSQLHPTQVNQNAESGQDRSIMTPDPVFSNGEIENNKIQGINENIPSLDSLQVFQRDPPEGVVPSLDSIHELERQRDRVERSRHQLEREKNKKHEMRKQNIQKIKDSLNSKVNADEERLAGALQMRRHLAEVSTSSKSQCTRGTVHAGNTNGESSADGAHLCKSDTSKVISSGEEDSDASGTGFRQDIRLNTLRIVRRTDGSKQDQRSMLNNAGGAPSKSQAKAPQSNPERELKGPDG